VQQAPGLHAGSPRAALCTAMTRPHMHRGAAGQLGPVPCPAGEWGWPGAALGIGHLPGDVFPQFSFLCGVVCAVSLRYQVRVCSPCHVLCLMGFAF